MQFTFWIIHGAGLMLFISQDALAQRWRKEFEDERPVDLESSGDDYFFEDDEMDDEYSASGSGFSELESGLDFTVRYTTQTPILPPTVSVLKPAPTIHGLPPIQSTWVPPTTQSSVILQRSPWVDEDSETPSIDEAFTPTNPSKEESTMAAVTSAIARSTEVRRLQPVVVVSTVAASIPSSTAEEALTWETTDEQLVTSTTEASEGQWPTDDAGVLPTSGIEEIEDSIDRVTPTQEPQTDSWEVTVVTSRDSDFEIPVSGGPSGDFEIQEEEGGTHTESPTVPDLGNEVLPPGPRPSEPGRGRKADTGLIDNTIDSGNTLAQMPQKNILERREVLIVSSEIRCDSKEVWLEHYLPAFLVMLLNLSDDKRKTRKYALEEPKPASVSYQKPDNHEEFYA
ncbi:syndecan-3 [Bombina bombina]|uniref:syndecan-3 n=1 Tax=Bombina bombina TaxID=8345 RepID=UPI00235B2964|nr:syndecan-3 [Bombina bombina]